jgi:hypothetical protein
MKYIMKIRIPNDHGNSLIKDPQFGAKMQQALTEVRAEASYFGTIDGCRGAYVVVNMNDASQMVEIAEPFFLWLKADIDFFPVMTPQDLANASGYMEKSVKKWG